MDWAKILWMVLAGLNTFLAVIYLVGRLLPRDHVVARRLVLKAAPSAVWARISDMSAAPQWRSNVKAVMRLADRNGHEVWREDYTSGDSLSFETLQATAPTLVVRSIVDSTAFGGTWRIEIAPQGDGSRVTITESGWVASPMFRTLATLVFGFSGTIETYLKALGKSFGENGSVQSGSER